MDKIRQIQGFTLSLSFSWNRSVVLWVCVWQGLGRENPPWPPFAPPAPPHLLRTLPPAGLWWLASISTACPSPVPACIIAPSFPKLLPLNPHHQPLLPMSITFSGTLKVIVGSSLGFGDSKLSEHFSPWLAQLLSGLCCCFRVFVWGLLHMQASPRKWGTGLPFTGSPPNQTELSIIFTQGWVTAKQES